MIGWRHEDPQARRAGRCRQPSNAGRKEADERDDSEGLRRTSEAGDPAGCSQACSKAALIKQAVINQLAFSLLFAYNGPMALTKRQKEFLDFLAGFLEKNGYCPSYEEIADGLSLASLATVHKHILALESKHYLKRGFNQSRSLEIAS